MNVEIQIEGICIPISAMYGGYGGGENKYLILEHDTANRYRRIGRLSAGSIGNWIEGWDEDKSVSITLI